MLSHIGRHTYTGFADAAAVIAYVVSQSIGGGEEGVG